MLRLNDTSQLVTNTATEYGGGAYTDELSTLRVQGNASVRQNTQTNANMGGGGIALFDQSALALIDSAAVRDNTASGDGGGILTYDSTLEVFDSAAIRGNTVSGDGGGIHGRFSTITMTDTVMVSDNAASLGHGGGVYFTDGCTISCTKQAAIDSNVAKNGAGVYLDDASFRLAGNASISRNTASAAGGAVYALNMLQNSRTLKLLGGAVASNKADSGGGGALKVGFEGQLDVHNALFLENTAGQSGGVLSVDATAEISSFVGANCTRNHALRGGVAYISGGGSLLTNKSYYNDNSANLGGCFYVDANSHFSQSADTHSNSRATTGEGAATYAMLNSEVSATGCTYVGGIAQSNGGAFYVNLALRFAVSGSTFQDNTGMANGGALYVIQSDDQTLSVADCVFERNNAESGGGGAAYFESIGSASAPTQVTDCVMRENVAGENGGAVQLKDSNIRLENIRMDRNEAGDSGGGLCAEATVLDLVQVGMRGNSASSSGGGLFAESTSTVQATGAWFSFNIAEEVRYHAACLSEFTVDDINMFDCRLGVVWPSRNLHWCATIAP